MFVPLSFLPSPFVVLFIDLVVVTANIILTTLGRLTFRRENGLSYNVLGPFRLPVPVMLQSLSTMSCMSLVGTRAVVAALPIWVI